MAEQQSIISLNIGSQRVAMGVFDMTKKGDLVLKAYASHSILADPATEASRMPQVQLAIKELAQELKIGKARVCYALSGQMVLNRFVKLPPLEEENIDELVRFEAQQNFPFPIDEVIWDWQVLPNDGIEKEVILVAIKTDVLNDISEMVAETGLHTEFVDSSPTALYNSLRFNYPDLEESTLLLDVGAKSSNLVYVDGKKFFTRSINIGGGSLTSAIAKEYGVSFAEAESSKLGNGLVSMGSGHTAQLDESTAALGTLIRNSLSRLNAQISQTTTLFRTQHNGGAPKRILLAGGGANLPYFKEFLEDKFNLPVEYYNGLRRVSVGNGVDVDAVSSAAHQFGELVGLAVRRGEKASLNIDLVPDDVGAERDINRRKPLLIAAAACLLVGLAAWAALKKSDESKAADRLVELNAAHSKLEAPSCGIEKVDADQQLLTQRMDDYAQLEQARKAYLEIFEVLGKDFAHDEVWITDFRPVTGYTLAKDELEDIVDAQFATAGPDKSAVKAGANTDAVIISGLWRESSQDVYALIKKLRENSDSVFAFKFEDTALDDSAITRRLELEFVEGDYAAPFELVLPLKSPITVK